MDGSGNPACLAARLLLPASHRIAPRRSTAGWDFGDAEQLQPLQCFGSVPTLVGAQSVSSRDLDGGYEAGGSFG